MALLFDCLILVLALNCAHGTLFSIPQPSWDVTRCSNVNPIEDSKTIFLSARGKWSDDKFCMAVRTDLKVIDETAYQMTVTFNNVRGGVIGVNTNTIGYGHLGFAFNYWDKDNYDFVYKRVHSNSFAYGKVTNGVLQFTSASAGGNPSITSGKWYSLRIEVSTNKGVRLFLNNNQIGTFNAHYTTRGYGGLIVATGYDNDVLFRDYDVAPKVERTKFSTQLDTMFARN